jgi:hypothetical protein
VAETQVAFGERYYLASLVLTGFTIMSFLRGFSELLVDLVERPWEAERLADLVFGFEGEVLRQLPAHGFHGAAFYDDWGTQDSLILSPALWRRRFRPRYRRQFELGRRYAGRVCFVCPVSYQTTAISGTEEDIRREVGRLVRNLGRGGGGLIGYVEEYSSIGMSEANYRACIRAFRELGGYPLVAR